MYLTGPWGHWINQSEVLHQGDDRGVLCVEGHVLGADQQVSMLPGTGCCWQRCSSSFSPQYSSRKVLPHVCTSLELSQPYKKEKVYVRVPLQFEEVMAAHIPKYCRKKLVRANVAPVLVKNVWYLKGGTGGDGENRLGQSLQIKILLFFLPWSREHLVQQTDVRLMSWCNCQMEVPLVVFLM